MLEEIGYKVRVRVLSDATAAMAKGRRYGPKQDVVEAGMTTFCHLSSAENPVDLLSKSLTGNRHLKLRRELGLRTQYTDQAGSRSWSTEKAAVEAVCALTQIRQKANGRAQRAV